MDPADASLAAPTRPARTARPLTPWAAALGAGWLLFSAELPDAPWPTAASASAMLAVFASAALFWPAAWSALARRRRERALQALAEALREGRPPARIEYPGVRDDGNVIEVAEASSGDGARAALALGHALAVLVTLCASDSAATTSALGLTLAALSWVLAWSLATARGGGVRFDGPRRRIEQWAGGAVELDVPVGALRGMSLREGLERSPEGPVARRWVELRSGRLGAPFRTAHAPGETRPVSVRVPNLPEPVQDALGRRLAEMFADG